MANPIPTVMWFTAWANKHRASATTISHYIGLAIVVVAVGIFVGTRFFRLEADPDTALTWSSTFFADEGLHGGNAAHKILAGTWLATDFNHMLLMPMMAAHSVRVV